MGGFAPNKFSFSSSSFSSFSLLNYIYYPPTHGFFNSLMGTIAMHCNALTHCRNISIGCIKNWRCNRVADKKYPAIMLVRIGDISQAMMLTRLAPLVAAAALCLLQCHFLNTSLSLPLPSLSFCCCCLIII